MAAPKLSLSNDPAAFKRFERRSVSSEWFPAAGDEWATVGIFVLFLALGLVGWMAAYWLA